jgi:hypothetical protein
VQFGTCFLLCVQHCGVWFFLCSIVVFFFRRELRGFDSVSCLQGFCWFVFFSTLYVV